MTVIQLEIPDGEIERIIRQECADIIKRDRSAETDSESEQLRLLVAKIKAKSMITINELRVLFGNCSRATIGKLLEEADAGTTENPIPYCTVGSGLVMFEPEAVLAWSRVPKPRRLK